MKGELIPDKRKHPGDPVTAKDRAIRVGPEGCSPSFCPSGAVCCCRHTVWLCLPLLSADWLSLPPAPPLLPKTSACLSLWLTEAPALRLMLRDSTFQGPDSKFMGGRTLLAQLGRQPSLVPLLWLGWSTVDGVVHSGWGDTCPSKDHRHPNYPAEHTSGAQWMSVALAQVPPASCSPSQDSPQESEPAPHALPPVMSSESSSGTQRMWFWTM